jgi:hypothetical protein
METGDLESPLLLFFKHLQPVLSHGRLERVGNLIGTPLVPAPFLGKRRRRRTHTYILK